MFNEDLLIEDHESTGGANKLHAASRKRNFKTIDGTPRCLETLNDEMNSSDGIENQQINLEDGEQREAMEGTAKVVS